jgi:hypothetical protein
MRVPFLFLSLVIVASAFGRIGETPIQFADRYGRPKDTNLTAITDKSSPLVEGAVHHTYEYQGWRIRAAFLQLDGRVSEWIPKNERRSERACDSG